MHFAESFATALGSLSINKLRAILTMLGVVIGVAAVITLLAIGDGVSASIEGEIQGIGSDVITIVSDVEKSGGWQNLSLKDVAAIKDPLAAPDVRDAVAVVQGNQQVLYGGRDAFVPVYGVEANHFDMRSMELASGVPLMESDVDTQARVAVLGANVAKRLFPGYELSIGQDIRIGGAKYRVVGVLKSKGGLGMVNYDERVFIPLSTAQARLYTDRTRSGDRVVQMILVQSRDAKRIDQTMEQVRGVLRRQHGIAYEVDDDFRVFSQGDILDAAGTITGIMTLFLGSIAGISLLVGGIGIMNIMLVSVTERTREIGIRKAVGALKRDIMLQFLIESVVISLVGGVLGIALGSGASAVVGLLVADLTPVVSAGSVLMSFTFAVAVGLVFGIYPAWRAANMRPIEALRYD